VFLLNTEINEKTKILININNSKNNY